MKRVLVALVAGTILSGAAAVYATATFTVGEARASAQAAAPVR
ncbi:hypothetical protein J2Y54_000788 [Sphingomonas sp. BE123]|jgi:hypothetical protein|nr:hypothetical protein [Sphingomonas sp. BE123]MDR6851295.1 hypothetical protein [Sphingomonas sp. BE123]